MSGDEENKRSREESDERYGPEEEEGKEGKEGAVGAAAAENSGGSISRSSDDNE